MPKFVLDLPSAVVCTVQTRVNGTELFCLKTKPFRDDDLVVSLKVSDNYQSFKVYRSGEVYMGVVKDRGQTTSSAASKTASAASTMISRVVSKSKKFMVDKILLDKILTFKINYNSQGKIESVSIPPNTPIMRLISFVASGQKSLLEAKHAMDRSKVKFLASTFGSLEGVKVIYDVLFDTDVTASRWNEVGVTIYPDSARCGLDTCEPKEEEMPKHLLLQDVFDYIRPGALPPASAASADVPRPDFLPSA